MARVKNTRQIMEVMQAYLDGKKIEALALSQRHSGLWQPVVTPPWNWACYDYRVKQEPREFCLAIDMSGKIVGVVNPAEYTKGVQVIKVREVL